MNNSNIQCSTTPFSHPTTTIAIDDNNSTIINHSQQLVFDFEPMFDSTTDTSTSLLQEELLSTHQQETQQPDKDVKSNEGNLTLTTPYHYFDSSTVTSSFFSEQDPTMNTVNAWPGVSTTAFMPTTNDTLSASSDVALSSSSMAPPLDVSYHIDTNAADIDMIPPARGDIVSLSTLLKHFPDVPKYLGHPQFGTFVNYWYTVQKCITLARIPHHRSVVIRRLHSLFSFELGTLILSILQGRVQVTRENRKNEDLEKQTPYIIGAIQALKDRTQAIHHILQKIEDTRMLKGQDNPMLTIIPILQHTAKQRKEQQLRHRQFSIEQQFQSPTTPTRQRQQHDLNLINVMGDKSDFGNNITPFMQSQENQQTVYSNNNNIFVQQQTSFPATCSSLTAMNMFEPNNNDNDNFDICVQPSDLSMQQQYPYQSTSKLSSEVSDVMLPQQRQQQFFEQPFAFTSTSTIPTTTEAATSFMTPLQTPSSSSYFDSSAYLFPLPFTAVTSSVSSPHVASTGQHELSEVLTRNLDIKMESDVEEEKQDIASAYNNCSGGSGVNKVVQRQQGVERQESENINFDETDEYETDDAGDDEDDDYFESEYIMESESSEDVMDFIDDDDEDDDDYVDGRTSSSAHSSRKRGRPSNSTCRRGQKKMKQQTNKKANTSLTTNKRSLSPFLHQQQQQRRPRAPRLYTRRTATSYDADTTHYLKSVFFNIYSKRDKLTKEQRKQVQIHTGLKPRNITYWFSNHKRRFQNSLQVFKQAVNESKGKIKSYDDFLEWRRKRGLPEDILESEIVAAEHLFTNNNNSNEDETNTDRNSCTSSLPSPPPTEDSDINSVFSTIAIPIASST
ncbi:hypothetical protein INT45_011536 [Circinella minor]|uniref:Homeobox domain-containing protein n=1 Tax=Circinella minor TaxID=1195481 RepID=A0A8H7VJT9_9FUNG|nr:hypothetical protein INT45_011536 [Circinella minor]